MAESPHALHTVSSIQLFLVWGLWTFYTLRAELNTSREIAQDFLRLAKRLPYPALEMRGHWALQITFTHSGEFDLALDHYEKALALYDPKQHVDDSYFYALIPGWPCRALPPGRSGVRAIPIRR